MDSSNNNLDNDISNNVNTWTPEHINVINYVCKITSLNKTDAIRGLQHYNGDYKTLIKDYTADKIINIVMRQTVYTREETISLLQKYDGDYKRIIKEYIGVNEKNKSIVVKSTNQKMFGEIRYFMDNVKTQYDKRIENKKNQEIITNYINSLKQSIN